MTSEPRDGPRGRRSANGFAALAPKVDQAERLLKAVANAHRLAILCELHKGEACVGHLLVAVGISQSALSQHLARLRADALVKTRRRSQLIYYSLADDRAKQLIEVICAIFCKTPWEARRPGRQECAGAPRPAPLALFSQLV